MNLAICINCGSEKSTPRKRCPVCGFVPRTDEQIARSIAASTRGWVVSPDDAPTPDALHALGEQIKAGDTSGIREDLVKRLLEEKKRATAPWSKKEKRSVIIFSFVLFMVPLISIIVWLMSCG